MNKLVIVRAIILVAALSLAGYLLWAGYIDIPWLKEHERNELPVPEVELETKTEIQGGTIQSNEESGTITYVNDEYGFSFEYENELNISSLPDFGGDVILIRDDELERDFQMYIAPYDEPEPITRDRILEDLPDMIINEPQHVLIGKEKNIQALKFDGESEDFGETLEVWFVEGGHLYQVIAEKGSDEFVGPIVESMSFQSNSNI